MTAIHFVYIEIILMIWLNLFILRLYRKYLFLKENQSAEGLEFNSPSLFSRTTFNSFMLRLPIPIISDLKYDGIQEVVKKHNKLNYAYYVLCIVFLIHFSIYIL
jgi:hypothetical protein